MCLVLCGLLGCAGNSPAPIEDRAATAPSQAPAYTVKRGDTLYSIAFRYGTDFRKLAAANGIAPPYTIYPGQHILLHETPYMVRPPAAPAPAASAAPVITRAAPPTVVPAPRPAPQTMPASRPVAPASPPAPAAVPEPLAPPSSVQPDATGVSTAAVVPAVPAAVPQAVEVPPQPQPKTDADAFAGEKVVAWRWPTSGPVTRGYSESVHKGIDIGGARGDPVTAVAAGKVVYAGTGIAGFGELLIIKHNDVYLSAYGHNDALLVAEGDVVAAGQPIAQKGSSGTDSVKLHFEIREEGKPIDPQRLLPRR